MNFERALQSVFLIIWVIFALLSFITFYDADLWYIPALYTLLTILVLLSLHFLNIYLVDHFWEKRRYSIYIIFFIAQILIFLGLRNQLHILIIGNNLNNILITDPVNRRFFFILISTILVVVGSFLYRIIVNYYRKEKKYAELKELQKSTELQFLKAQINPHFLFNTLNNIYALSVIKSEKTPEMILLISDILRYAIYEGKNQQVMLGEEISAIHKLIKLFQLRSRTPLNIRFDTEGNIAEKTISPMLLIPLVENCFKHSDITENEFGFIHISLVLSPESIVFETSNSIGKIKKQNDEPSGIGLDNIQKRLGLLYPGKSRFELFSDEYIFKVIITLNL